MAIKQNFYNGLKVSPVHLNGMQEYTEKCDSELVSELLGYGIVAGFKVDFKEKRKIVVESGLAYSKAGVRLESTGKKEILITDSHIENSINRTITLGLKFKYDTSDEKTDSQAKKVDAVWKPSVELVLGNDVIGDVLPIADIKFYTNGIADGIERIIENGKRFVNLIEQGQTFSITKNNTENEENTTANINSNALNIDSDNVKINATEFNLNAGSNTLLKSLSSLVLDSSLINLKTKNLQIDGENYIDAIMERGSNGNGHYVKFESGLLVCWGVITTGTFSFNLGDYRSIKFQILPIRYIGSYAISTNSHGGGSGIVNVSAYLSNSTGFQIYYTGMSKKTSALNLYSYLTIGMWK